MLVNFKKVFVALTVCLFATSNIYSQDLINVVPNQCLVSGMFDLKLIESKANIKELLKLQLFQKLNLKIAEEIFGEIAIKDSISVLDLQKCGVSTQSKSWFYVKKSKVLYYGALLFALDNEAIFSEFVRKSIKAGDDAQIIDAGKYKYINKKDVNIVWNSKTIAFYGASVFPSIRDSIRRELEPQSSDNYYDNFPVDTTGQVLIEEPIEETTPIDDETIDESDFEVADEIQDSDSIELYEDLVVEDADTTANDYLDLYEDSYQIISRKVDEKCDSIESFWCSTNAEGFIQDKGPNSMFQNKEFTEYIKSSPDAAFVLDYGFISDFDSRQMSYGMYGLNSLTGIYSDFLKEFYKTLLLYGKIELKQDEVLLRYDLKYSQKMIEMFKDVKKTKISGKFLKYLNNDLMGYTAIGIDIPGYFKGMGNILRQFYPTVPKYGEAIGASMEILDIIIDEEALYNVFTGDMVLALNGIKPVEATKISYDYDDNYNMTERTDTFTQMQPEVLFMAGIGNVDDVKKILKLLVVSQVFSLENGLYSLSYKSADLPVFMKIADDILFISNNKSYVENPVSYAKDKQLSKDHTKMFSKNTAIFYANAEKIVKQSAFNEKSGNEKIINQAGNVFSSLKVTAGQKNGNSYGNLALHLSKTNDNSITDIFKFLNEFYLFKTTRFD